MASILGSLFCNIAPYAISLAIFVGGFSAIFDSIETSAKGRPAVAAVAAHRAS